MKSLLAALMIMGGFARGLAAQEPQAGCSYDRCALQLVPRLWALDLVRGSGDEQVGSLSFFVPKPVRSAFVPIAPAQAHADRAFTIRRVAAVLTDAGGVLALMGATRAAATADHRRASVGVGVLGVVALGVSVPLQFRADAELSHAVHEFNRQFAR